MVCEKVSGTGGRRTRTGQSEGDSPPSELSTMTVCGQSGRTLRTASDSKSSRFTNGMPWRYLIRSALSSAADQSRHR
jgi:hypothetical protein